MKNTPPQPAETGHNHKVCVNRALDNADAVCRAKGLNLTNTRKKVLKLVWQGHQAVKAYDLIELLDTGKGVTKPPTVYRALDFLVEHGFVHRIESLNAFVGCAHPGQGHEGNFFICDNCRDISEMEGMPLRKAIDDMADESEFTVSHKTIEIHGTCSRCTTA